MTRLYYTCPIQALYMMKEFGVKFSEASGANRAGRYYLIDTDIEKIYVAKESEHIFDQQKGDIGIQEGDWLAIARALDIEDFEENDGAKSPSKYWTIIMRNDKLFFNPMREYKEARLK